jgi:hypothetical protein
MTQLDQNPDFERIDRLLNKAKPIEMAITAPRAIVLLSQLQLALRHPENNGVSAEIARDMARRLSAHLSAIDPAIAALIAQGWHPEFDATREEFEQQQRGDHR